MLCYGYQNKPRDLKKTSEGFRASYSVPLSSVPVYLIFIRSCVWDILRAFSEVAFSFLDLVARKQDEYKGYSEREKNTIHLR